MTRYIARTVYALAALLSFSVPIVAADSIELAHDERLLRDAGIATDPKGLLAYFRSRTPSAADQARLSTRVVELGSEEFEVRERASQELRAGGRFALPLVRAVVNSTDAEVARRAARCIEEIESAPMAAQMASAARLAQERPCDGMAEAMLGSLPWIEDETAEDAMFQALTRLGLSNGKADTAILRAANASEPVRRAAAAFVLGQANTEARTVARRLLVDLAPRVRFQAANGLVRNGDKSAVPVLIDLLSDGPASLIWPIEDLLGRVAGPNDLPSAAGADADARRKARTAWETWWRTNAANADLTRITREEPYLGLNLVVELDSGNPGGQGRIWECGADGKSRWHIDGLNRPIDAQYLPTGRILVAEHGGNRVTERQRDGKIIWEHRVNGNPVSCQRLPNGNTFITTYNELIEITPEKKVVFSLRQPGGSMMFFGRKLRNGHIVLINASNRVLELDATGKQLSELSVENTGGWASVELLPTGNFLVALFNAKKVVEFDRSGKVLWQCHSEAPGHATRLRNGNTLVASIEGRCIAEYDRAGKQVWKQATTGRPFHVYRR